ncbi:MAG TPA: chemotaxis protein CheW [Gaiellaceae bacterium]|nr:chemotaxis protein CheW [Gaiellaceae bacterium]HWB21758.1 chemotaxis protein CheW [Gaiellaceae bacterium]
MTGVHVRMRIGDELYALPVANVLEIADLGEISPVPGTASAVLGVRNLRGRVLPVFDLALLFGVSGQGGAPSKLVVAEHHGRQAGLAIDEVTDVAELADATTETGSEFLSGSTLEDGKLVGVIDAGQVFSALEGHATQ